MTPLSSMIQTMHHIWSKFASPGESRQTARRLPGPRRPAASRVPALTLLPAVLLLIAAAGTACRQAEHEPAVPPNILLISLDACRADHLASYGYHRKTSPFIDSLVDQGILFTRAFANNLGTTTSHTSMLSSLHQESHRVEYRAGGDDAHFERISDSVVMVQELLYNHGYITLGVTDGGRLSHDFGFDRGFVEYIGRWEGMEKKAGQVTDLVGRYRHAGKPMFVFFHTYEIHGPYLPPEPYKSLFAGGEELFNPTIDNLREFKYTARRDLEPERLAYIEAMYDAGIRQTDGLLQEMFAGLQALGFLDNALVIITADHGEEFGDHGGLLHRCRLYDEFLHVPLIITGRGVPRGLINPRLVSLVDIATTILGRSGLESLPRMEGRDLVMLPIRTADTDEAVFAQCGNSLYAVRTRDWKLIERPESGRTQLYNMKSDPRERMNLSNRRKDRADLLLARLTEWRAGRPVIGDTAIETADQEALQLSEDELEKLKQLGYVAEDEGP